MKRFDSLLRLPLFMGISSDYLQQIVAHTKFGFSKRENGDNIVTENERCDSIVILTNGTMEISKYSDDHGYCVLETVSAPCLIQPEHLFGLTQRYSATFTAVTQCNLMTLGKTEVMFLFEQFDVFRINYLNVISTSAQRSTARLWRHVGSDDRSRVTEFFLSHCQRPVGRKVFKILMNRLAMEINTSRLDVSRVLNQMQHEGIIELSRGRIVIPEVKRLIQDIR